MTCSGGSGVELTISVREVSGLNSGRFEAARPKSEVAISFADQLIAFQPAEWPPVMARIQQARFAVGQHCSE